MPTIPEIGAIDVGISSIDIPAIDDWTTSPFNALPEAPPVTLIIGTPVIEIPGCVRAHKESNRSKILRDDDPRGVQIFCDGSMPFFDPLIYSPEDLIFSSPAPVPKINPAKDTEDPPPDKPEIPGAAVPPVLPCPLPGSLPIGSKNKSQSAIIIRYELQNGKCVAIEERLPVVEIINNQLPEIPVVVTTTTIAVLATTAAVLAKPLGDYLLKLIKPTVKKLVKKIAAIRGKTKTLSTAQKREEQRSLRKK